MDKIKELVKKEADNLKKFATKEELSRLDFSQLIPASSERCIYGQMTGDCYSDRAVQLLKQCAEPFSDNIFVEDREKATKINGTFDLVTEGPWRRRTYSAIEWMIYNRRENNKSLIDYLKGETNELVLK